MVARISQLSSKFSGYQLYSPANSDHTIVHEKLQWLFIHRRAMVVHLATFTVIDLSDWYCTLPTSHRSLRHTALYRVTDRSAAHRDTYRFNTSYVTVS